MPKIDDEKIVIGDNLSVVLLDVVSLAKEGYDVDVESHPPALYGWLYEVKMVKHHVPEKLPELTDDQAGGARKEVSKGRGRKAKEVVKEPDIPEVVEAADKTFSPDGE